jgi:predicted Zn-dependent peptidase
VKAAASPMLGSYLDRHYRGPAMVIAAAGAVDHDRLVDLAGNALADLAGEAGPAPVAAAYHGGEMREDRDLMETQIMLGFQGIPYGGDDFYAAQVLSSIIGGGMSSRLFQEVREKRGLCYSIYAFHWSFADTGVFGVHAATGPEDVNELMPVIVDELERATDSIKAPRRAPGRSHASFSCSAASSRPTNWSPGSRRSRLLMSANSPRVSSAAPRPLQALARSTA